MKIFILSTSYLENTFLVALSYLYKDQISEIILLSENHRSDEYNNFKKIKIKLINNLFDAVDYCDKIIVIDSGECNLKKVEKCKQISESLEKDYHYIDAKISSFSMINTNFDKQLDYNSFPSILILSLGEFNQISALELALKKALRDDGINVYSECSSMTYAVLNNIRDQNIFKEMSIQNHNKYDIIVKTIEAKDVDEIKNNIEIVQQIYQLNPDYLILICENDSYDNIELFMKYKYNCLINSFIRSNYASIFWGGKSFPILTCRDGSNLNAFLEPNNMRILLNDIIEHITYPKGIDVVK